jgi:hypothetical protein
LPFTAAAVKYALRKMRAQDAAEEKKRQRQAKLDSKRDAGEGADIKNEPAAPKAAKAAAKGKGKRGRKAVEEVEEEADEPVAAAKKVKA